MKEIPRYAVSYLKVLVFLAHKIFRSRLPKNFENSKSSFWNWLKPLNSVLLSSHLMRKTCKIFEFYGIWDWKIWWTKKNYIFNWSFSDGDHVNEFTATFWTDAYVISSMNNQNFSWHLFRFAPLHQILKSEYSMVFQPYT